LKYHPGGFEILTDILEAGCRTGSGGEFDWGGHLLKGNGGVRWCPQAVWKSAGECKGRRALDCETHKSSRCESRS
jgi:hypothetical protein